MPATLYVYEHCPYCVKARMIFGLKDVPVNLQYVLNDDIETPTTLIGKKMVPILVDESGNTTPESLDIVHKIDQEAGTAIVSKESSETLAAWLQDVKSTLYALAMPRWVKMHPALPEFATQGAIDYFTEKKEAYLGMGFDEALERSDTLISTIDEKLKTLETVLTTAETVNSTLSEDDFHLYAALHSLSIVSNIKYPEVVEHYRNYYERVSKVPLLDEHAL